MISIRSNTSAFSRDKLMPDDNSDEGQIISAEKPNDSSWRRSSSSAQRRVQQGGAEGKATYLAAFSKTADIL